MDISLIRSRIRFSISASEITKKRHLGRIQTMADVIEVRFSEVENPEQIKLKHLFYIRDHWFEDQGYSVATTRDYTRSMVLMISALGREQHWLGPLKLEKDSKKGGRPTIGRAVRSKSRLRRS